MQRMPERTPGPEDLPERSAFGRYGRDPHRGTTGAGSPRKNCRTSFKPFFTTKPQGTGLGLVIVKKMLANMNGTIEFESRLGAGTMVSIALPEGRDEKK